ncbi:MAG: TrlF family AAA-like ATPase [Candidatus Zixiibacteriota bacterium]
MSNDHQFTFSRGSEWRKWDLHLHTPKSICQDYGGDTTSVWDAFINKIASLPPEVQVLGITDYLFVDGYEHLLTRRDEIPNIKLLIPNIEFRLNTFSGSANSHQRHNFHILFSPFVEVNDIKDQLLNCLSSGYKLDDNTEWRQTPTRRSLEDLGRQMKANAPVGNTIHQKSDLQVGFQNITYKLDDILKLLEKSCFTGKYVLGVGYSEWDQSRWDQSAAEKRNLINKSHFSMTCVDDPEKIEEHRDDLRSNSLNSLVLHASDSHNIDRVGKTLQWIKADPTFTGLKQVLNEPIARVFVGNTPPNYKPDHKVIKRIIVKTSSNWFDEDYSIDLNRDLVTIIGGRGSGKSALAEAIAYGAGSKDNRAEAFLNKAAKHKESITGTSIELEWADKSVTEFQVGKLDSDRGLVRYLPQGAVEELCSPQHVGELQDQIENVIFQSLEPGDKLGASGFAELQKKSLRQFALEKDRLVTKIRDINKDIAQITNLVKNQSTKQKLLDKKKTELEQLLKTLPTLPDEDKEAQDQLSDLEEQKSLIEDIIAEKQQLLVNVSEVESRVAVFQFAIDEFKEEIKTLLASAGMPRSKEFDVTLDARGVAGVIDERRKALNGEIETIRQGAKKDVASLVGIVEDNLLAKNLEELSTAIEKKAKETKAFETLKLKYQRQKKLIQTSNASIKSLELEIEAITKEQIPRKSILETERQTHYKSFFNVLSREKKKIEQLYKPLQDSLSHGSTTKRQLVFEATVRYDLSTHNRTGLDIIDRTRKGNYRDLPALRTKLETSWDNCTKQGSTDSALVERLTDIEDSFKKMDGDDLSIEEQLRENMSIEEFYNWLYDPTVFSVESSLKFDDVELYLLSPGQKGIVLLMLYLAIDKEDTRPLIIDQPEENLDSLSVCNDLIQYFRDRKIYRQIIMVTHNPNLVVNTDSEQVIIAEYRGKETPRLRYTSGSLENQAEKLPDIPVEDLEDGIIEQVCDILEGGETAFSNRKRKYQLSDKAKNL